MKGRICTKYFISQNQK